MLSELYGAIVITASTSALQAESPGSIPGGSIFLILMEYKMKVKDLIEELSKYNPENRVVLSSHGSGDEDEIIGCYETTIYSKNDEFETVVELYEY